MRTINQTLRAAVVAAGVFGVTAVAPAAAGSRGLTVPVRASEAADAAVVEQIELYAGSRALVIGIDAYRNGWPRLSTAVQDARLVAEELTRQGFDVTLRTDLTSTQLKQAFEEFFVVAGENPEMRLFVWFAGHGHTDNGEGYLVPVDAPTPETGARFRLMALSLRRFGEFVRQARAKHAFAVFDSCFAGTIFDSARALPPPAITHATSRPARQFLSSGDAGQTVSDTGAFRELFLRALRGEENADVNGDGYLTAAEIGIYMTDRITNLTQARQTPRYGNLRDKDYDRGDFVFALPASASRVAVTPARPARPSRSAPPDGPGGERATYDRQVEVEISFWKSIDQSRNPADFRAYLQRFGERGAFSLLAHNRILALETKQGLGSAETPAEALLRARAMLKDLLANAGSVMGDKTVPLGIRLAKFRGMLGYVVDFEPMAKFVLGAHRDRISEDQWQRFYRQYRELFLSGYKFNTARAWTGKFELVEVREYGPDHLVRVDFTLPNHEVVRLGFRIRHRPGSFFGFMIIDLMVNGASLLVTQRDDFASALAAGGIEHLITVIEERFGKIEKVLDIPG